MPADFTITYVEYPQPDIPGFIGLIDEDAGDTSVTNDAENVVKRLQETLSVDLDQYVILYRDSMGLWDRIVTREGRYVGIVSSKGARSFDFAKAFWTLLIVLNEKYG